MLDNSDPRIALRTARLWQSDLACAVDFEGDEGECAKALGFAKAKLRHLLKTHPGATSLKVQREEGVEIEIYTRPNRIRIKAGAALWVTIIDQNSPVGNHGNQNAPPYQVQRDRFLYRESYPEHLIREHYYAGSVVSADHSVGRRNTNYWRDKNKVISWTNVGIKSAIFSNPDSCIYVGGKFWGFTNVNVIAAAIKGRQIRLLTEEKINSQYIYKLRGYEYRLLDNSEFLALTPVFTVDISAQPICADFVAAKFSGNGNAVVFQKQRYDTSIPPSPPGGVDQGGINDVFVRLDLADDYTVSVTEMFEVKGFAYSLHVFNGFPVSTTTTSLIRAGLNYLAGFACFRNLVFYVYSAISDYSGSSQTTELPPYGMDNFEVTENTSSTQQFYLGLYDMETGVQSEQPISDEATNSRTSMSSGGNSGTRQSDDIQHLLTLIAICPEQQAVLFSLQTESSSTTSANGIGSGTFSKQYQLYCWQRGTTALANRAAGASFGTNNPPPPELHFGGLSLPARGASSRYAENGKILLASADTGWESHFIAYSFVKNAGLLASEFGLRGADDWRFRTLTVTT